MRATLATLFLGASASQTTWNDLIKVIEGNSGTRDVMVTVGGEDGQVVFEYAKGSITPDTSGPIYSATKWVSGVTVLGAVAEGFLDLDDPASKHLPFWTTDSSDPRSDITLRHLLGFVSGLSGGATSGCNSREDFFLECCEKAYARSSMAGVPGRSFEYNEFHVQMAGCMAVAASGQEWGVMQDKYIFQPAGMNATSFGPDNLALGAGFSSTAADYQKFLRKYFLGELLPAELHKEIETDQYPDAARSAFDEGWHYGFTSWIDCPQGVTEWGPACENFQMHSSGGTGGFRPIVNREYNYWLQVGYFGLPGIGGSATRKLVDLMVPVLADIFEGNSETPRLADI